MTETKPMRAHTFSRIIQIIQFLFCRFEVSFPIHMVRILKSGQISVQTQLDNKMAVQLWYMGVTFLVYLQYTDAGGSCQENVYLEVGKQGVVSCDFEDFHIIGWINGTGDVTSTSPFIHKEDSKIYGRGYRSGDYDMHPNGSLIINEVKLENEFNYTVLFVPHPTGANNYFEVPVKVYGGSCQENIYLEVGKQGVVSCHFEDFDIIGWIHGTGDVTSTSPFIHMEGSRIYGQGYESGDYGMHPNGSLIINEVKLENEFNYTVLFVFHPAGANKYFEVPVKVYVPPDPGYPVVNGRTNQVVIHGNTRGFINCSMTGIRPRVDLEWVSSSDEISLDSEHRLTDNNDGMYNTYLTSSYKVINNPTGVVSIICRVAGQMADLFPLVTTVYLLLEQRFPVINGLANQEHVVLDVNIEGELTCSMDKVSQDVALELVTIFPDSSDEILLDNKNKITVNGDDTVTITLTSRFRVLSASIRHFTLQCRVSGQAADKYPEATTVELLVTENFPVVNGLVHQQHVVLNVNREDKLTCTMNRVSQTMVLEWVFTPPVSSDEISVYNELSKMDNRDGTSNITLSSSFRVLSQSIHYVTLECRVVDKNDSSQHDVTTVALLFDKTTDQEVESLLSWQSNLAIVLLVFLVVNVIIFWLVFVFWMKRLKDFARKYHWIVTNPRQRKDLEDGTADNQDFQALSPLQPVNNNNNIDVTSQNKEIPVLSLLKKQKSHTDSGLSSSPNSSTASRDLMELEARNAQDVV